MKLSFQCIHCLKYYPTADAAGKCERSAHEREKMRPTILIDCDGVLANFTKKILQHVNVCMKEDTIDHSDYEEHHVTDWDIFTALPEAAKRYKSSAFDQVKAKGGCMSLGLYDGSQDGVRQLQELGDVYVVTSPMSGAETWHSERETWLRRHFQIPHDHVIHASAKHLVKGDVFVDDKPENVQAWRAAFPNKLAIVWDAPYNRDFAHETRARNWDELLRMVANV